MFFIHCHYGYEFFLANLHIFLSHFNLTTANNLLPKGHVIYVSMYARKFC